MNFQMEKKKKKKIDKRQASQIIQTRLLSSRLHPELNLPLIYRANFGGNASSIHLPEQQCSIRFMRTSY